MLIEVNRNEYELIQAALNTRMVYLGSMRKKEGWAQKKWMETLDLQCEFFNAEKEW